MKRVQSTTSWRELSIASYKAPSDSKIFGAFDVDITELLKYIAEQKKIGKRLTITHFVAAAIARSLYEDMPEINCYVRRGRIVMRKDANVFIAVSIGKGRDMSGIVIPKTQELSVTEISKIIREGAEKKRAGEESGVFASKEVLSKIPWPFRRWVFLFVKWWIFDIGLYFPFLKIPPDPFGSIMLTNIGTHGLTIGFPALFPLGRVPAVVVMGRAGDKPVVIDGEIKIRTILPLAATCDHRIVDGAQAGVLAHGIAMRLQNPRELDKPNITVEAN